MTAVTVLMGVYNGERFLRPAIDGILRQDFADFELLVIDDGSTDGTPQMLASYSDPRLRVLRNPANIGLTKSLNRGLREAKAPLIARHDADDVSEPTRLGAQVAAFTQQADLAIVGSQARVIDESGNAVHGVDWPKMLVPEGIRWQSMFESAFYHGAVMYRRDIILDRLGGYDEAYRTSQDFELWSRVVHDYPCRNLTDALINFRRHTGAVSRGYKPDMLERVRDVLRRNLDRMAGRSPNLPDDMDGSAWLDAWLRVNNSNVLPLPASSKPLTNAFRSLGALITREDCLALKRKILTTYAVRCAIAMARGNVGAAFSLIHYAFREDSATASSIMFDRVKDRLRR